MRRFAILHSPIPLDLSRTSAVGRLTGLTTRWVSFKKENMIGLCLSIQSLGNFLEWNTLLSLSQCIHIHTLMGLGSIHIFITYNPTLTLKMNDRYLSFSSCCMPYYILLLLNPICYLTS
jgi:hypothetical protein